MMNATPTLKPICFMVMPFGTKSTGITDGTGPTQVNFDTLWQKALYPALSERYTVVRADQDVGSLIIKDMLERLTLADVIVADLSIPNGNVYYEIGLRHAARSTGCALIAAEWGRPLFDTAQMRRITYSLAGTEVTEAEASKIKESLVGSVENMRQSMTPPFDLWNDFPKVIPSADGTFRKFVEELSAFQAEVMTARMTPKEARPTAVKSLLEKHFPEDATGPAILPGVAQELLFVVRDALGWKEALKYVERLPDSIQRLPIVREQHCLALSKDGKHLESIAKLTQLIEQSGDSSERQGLIGGRYKALYNATDTEPQKSAYLEQAIEHYERGMLLDLNDFFPSCNLPLLLKLRDEEGDAERARSISALVQLACERALMLKVNDPWIKPTLLDAAFLSEDVQTVDRYFKKVVREGAVEWRIDSLLTNLRMGVKLIQRVEVRQKFEELIKSLEQLTSKV